jgi:5-(carboxyamino)imidazole ribonucleotide mutase
MGSDSDFPTLRPAVELLAEFGIPSETRIVSAHRAPVDMIEYGRNARRRGVRVIIAGAGGAAHLPGMLASVTTLPVIGVPVPVGTLGGLDALLAIVQMPRGVPVATMAIGGAHNAALMAARILALDDAELAAALDRYAEGLVQRTRDGNDRLRDLVQG